jgi:hypothetical protein
MKSNIITVIPVYNGEKFILETLESVARQTLRPDRLIVLDNCSTDRSPEIVRSFQPIKCDYIRNPTNLGLFGNCNRALEFAEETNYLLILHADDLIDPKYFEVMTSALNDCPGRGLGYCLDERIDENGKRLSISGNITGVVREIPKDDFLTRKAEIANQAFSGSLLKTNHQAAPCKFRMDMPILADMIFWAEWGSHCDRIVQVDQALCKYRWHGENTTTSAMPGIQALVLDEWRVMETNEKLRGKTPGIIRRFKLRGLFAVRTGVKAKRIRQQNNLNYSREIVQEGKRIAGPLAWLMGQAVVEARDLLIYGILRRPKHPKNVYS